MLLARTNERVRVALPALAQDWFDRCAARSTNAADALHACPTTIWEEESGKRCFWGNINGRIAQEATKIADGAAAIGNKRQTLLNAAIPDEKKDMIREQIDRVQVAVDAASAELRSLMPTTMWGALKVFVTTGPTGLTSSRTTGRSRTRRPCSTC